jgi:predicted ATP-grasp superfamily ATP-dependent carboligase
MEQRESIMAEHLEPTFTGQAGAVVIGGDHQGLGIVRSLGRKGVPVCVIDDEHSISRYSRYTTHHIRLDELRDETRTVEQLLEIGQRLGLKGWVLFPTREETVAALSKHRERLAQYFRVPTPAWDSIQWAWDKRNTYTLAGQLDIPTPKTWYINCREELLELNLTFPVALKPAIKEHFVYATKAKAWRADDLQQLLELYDKAAAQVGGGEIMIQDLVPGDGTHQFAYCALFKDGTSIAKMHACRRRQHPAEFGRASTYVETIEMPELEALAEKFLRAISFYGLVEVEFKRDPRDGRLKLLDVNARTWGYHTLGRSAGVDFPYLLFADQVGQTIEPCAASSGVSWVRLATDIPTAMVELLKGRLNIGQYVKSLWQARTESVFAMDDLAPGMIELGLIPYLFIKRGF